MMAGMADLCPADDDVEARTALWRAVCASANDVRHRFRVQSIRTSEGTEVRPGVPLPAVATWRLVEALSLLCVILRSDEAVAGAIDILGKTGPIELHEDGVVRHLWAQQTLAGERSSLNARPEIRQSARPPGGNLFHLELLLPASESRRRR